jgi:hypothetical protein
MIAGGNPSVAMTRRRAFAFDAVSYRRSRCATILRTIVSLRPNARAIADRFAPGAVAATYSRAAVTSSSLRA